MGIQGVNADHSTQKMRIHKNFIKEVLDKNFHVILEHCEGLVKKNVYLTELNVRLDNLEMKLKQSTKTNSENHDLQTELFFDDGQIVMEIDGLEYSGEGMITDPTSGIQETVSITAALDLAQIVMSLAQDVND